jgi:hypothetical protein
MSVAGGGARVHGLERGDGGGGEGHGVRTQTAVTRGVGVDPLGPSDACFRVGARAFRVGAQASLVRGAQRPSRSGRHAFKLPPGPILPSPSRARAWLGALTVTVDPVAVRVSSGVGVGGGW